MSELHAALGLSVLDLVNAEVALRARIAARYRERLADLPGVTSMPELPGVSGSYQYFVIRVDEAAFGCSRDIIFDELKTRNVFTRKYFHPLCSEYACYAGLPSSRAELLPVASRVVREVLCLPNYGRLPLEAVDRICDMIAAVRSTA